MWKIKLDNIYCYYPPSLPSRSLALLPSVPSQRDGKKEPSLPSLPSLRRNLPFLRKRPSLREGKGKGRKVPSSLPSLPFGSFGCYAGRKGSFFPAFPSCVATEGTFLRRDEPFGSFFPAVPPKEPSQREGSFGCYAGRTEGFLRRASDRLVPSVATQDGCYAGRRTL
jgi:hypothetical protein